ncbi:MAG: DEAD/DEAH box helicase [Candidatus Thorarchaeota archaeon]|nr:DEAD/DEAH box helicase [Candidatus Thorarchaeota archaeon]
MSVPTPLSKDIVAFLKSKGIVKPTPIQEKAIPFILNDSMNSLLLAPTGTGKTEAAIIPLLSKLQQMSKRGELFGFYIIYITPLRALNRDVFKRIEELCMHLGLTVDVRHGDTTQYARRKQAIKPPNLLITTPESLQAILPGKRLQYHLKTVFAVVVDEVHDLAGSKRGVQLSLGLERLQRLVSTKIQRIGLSATVGNPDEVAKLLSGAEPIKTLWAGYDNQKLDLKVDMPLPTDRDKTLGRKISYPGPSVARLEEIIQLIETHNSVLVFTNTRSFAEVLGVKMRALKPSLEFDVHHGSLSKNARLTAEDRLKNGSSKAIIATSSLELGIDIGQADLVIQYSSPREVSRLVQRVGRSGHGVGRTSKGIVISTINLDDIVESGVIIRRARQNKVEDARIPMKAWDVLGHQISGFLLDVGEIERPELQELVRNAYPFSDISNSEMDTLLQFMAGRRLLEINGSRISKSSRTRMFYYERLSTIPDIKQVNAVDITTRTSIGVLDEDYVTANVEAGSVFVIRGRPWTVVSVDESSGEVMCSPVTSIDIDAPRWVGEMIPVPYEVATEVAKVWNLVMTKEDREFRRWLNHEYGVSGHAQNHIIETINETMDVLGDLPSADKFILEICGTGIILHAPLGTRANETLGIVIASLLTTRLGIGVAVERDPYRILFTSSEEINPEHLLDVLREYSANQASHILELAVKHTQNFASRFVHVARKMDVIRKEAKSKEIPVKYLIKSFEGTPVFDEAMREVLEEKMDQKRALEVFTRFSKGELKIHVVKTAKPSPLARLIIEEKTRFEVIGEITEENEVLRMMEERLLTKQFRMVCMAQGHWDSVRTISTFEETVECPICGSKMIAVLSISEKDFTKLIAKRVRGESLTRSEEKRYKAAVLTAELVSRYGKNALLVLAGRGIGATTASRILEPGLTERLDILRAIAKGELQYERTRPYW